MDRLRPRSALRPTRVTCRGDHPTQPEAPASTRRPPRRSSTAGLCRRSARSGSQREEVRIEHEPIADANADEAMDEPAMSEEEHEVTLPAEEPVVDKRAVPKERVRLDKDVQTEQRTVAERIGKEEIDVAVDGDPKR